MKKLFTAIRASDLEMVRQIIEKKPELVNCVAKQILPSYNYAEHREGTVYSRTSRLWRGRSLSISSKYKLTYGQKKESGWELFNISSSHDNFLHDHIYGECAEPLGPFAREVFWRECRVCKLDSQLVHHRGRCHEPSDG